MTSEALYERGLLLYSKVANRIREEQRELFTQLIATRNDPMPESIQNVYAQYKKLYGLLKWIDAFDRTISADVGIGDDLRGQYEAEKNKLYTESVIKLSSMKVTRERIQKINIYLQKTIDNLVNGIVAINTEQEKRKRVVDRLRYIIENFEVDRLRSLVRHVDEVETFTVNIGHQLWMLRKVYEKAISYLDQLLENEKNSYNTADSRYDIDKNRIMLKISKSIDHEEDILSGIRKYQENYYNLIGQMDEIDLQRPPFEIEYEIRTQKRNFSNMDQAGKGNNGVSNNDELKRDKAHVTKFIQNMTDRELGEELERLDHWKKDVKQRIDMLNGKFSKRILTDHRKDVGSWKQKVKNDSEKKNTIQNILSDENKIGLIS